MWEILIDRLIIFLVLSQDRFISMLVIPYSKQVTHYDTSNINQQKDIFIIKAKSGGLYFEIHVNDMICWLHNFLPLYRNTYQHHLISLRRMHCHVGSYSQSYIFLWHSLFHQVPVYTARYTEAHMKWETLPTVFTHDSAKNGTPVFGSRVQDSNCLPII